MRSSLTMCPAFYRSRKRSDDVPQVLGWLDDLVTAGIAGFDDADGISLLHLVFGEVLVLGDSSITRVR